MFNAKLRKTAIDNYNTTVRRHKKIDKELVKNAEALYEEREKAIIVLKLSEERINQLSNTHKVFNISNSKIQFELKQFDQKIYAIRKAEKEAKIAATGAGVSITLSAVGIAAATMGPKAATGIATTFGATSTETVISSLNGIAKKNATLDYSGYGRLVKGRGEINVGKDIACIMLVVSIVFGLYASYKNKKVANKITKLREELEVDIRKFDIMNVNITKLRDATLTQIKGVIKAEKELVGTDYSMFSEIERKQAGLLVNSTLTLAQLINKEIKINE